MTFVLLTGGIDLSVGAVAGVTAVLAATFMVNGMPVTVACILVLLLAALYGVFNGVCVALVGVPPFIATLGSMTSLRGVAYLVSGGSPVYGFPDSVKKFAQGSVAGIPYMVILMFLIFVAGAFILFKTRLGRYIYGVGGNEEASRLSGVHVTKVKLTVYASSVYT